MVDWNNPSNCTVLIVDDEPDNVEVLQMALQFFGMTVHSVQSGQAALDHLTTTTPDLILLDISMNPMDGWETRVRIKADPKNAHIPIVALTAHAMDGDKERALQAGFDGYVPKPIKVPTLLNDIQTTLAENKPVETAVEVNTSRSGE